MPINPHTVIARVRADIQDLRFATSPMNGVTLHAGIGGYCRALLECGIIDERQWELLKIQTDRALDKCKSASDSSSRLPGWPRAVR